VSQSIDKRIAAALSAATHEAADLGALITEVEGVIGSVTAEMTHSSAQMLDPMNQDFEASRIRVEKAKVMLARFEVSLPKLKALHAGALAAERLAKWNADLAALQITRDALADRFRTRYCEVVGELIDIFDEMAALDQQVDELNSRAHAAGARQRMRTTEWVARGIDSFTAGTKSILEEVQLPGFGLGSGEVKAVWPRPKPNFGSQIAAAMAPLFRGPQMDPALVAEANVEVEARGGTVFFGEAYRRAVERRNQAQAERWAEEGRERERVREANAAEDAQRHRDAAAQRRRQGM
jgi:hypothetical protein